MMWILAQTDWMVQWASLPSVRWTLTGMYLTVLGLVSIYGLHRYWLVWLYYRNHRRASEPAGRFQTLPTVTVQLPVFNESRVVGRVIDAACQLDYPKDKLQIQVLDDSTDGSDQIARQCVESWQARGVDIQLIHRQDRTGYKAGALANGLKTAKGELIAIFDADFVPQSEFLRQTVDYFFDPKVGMVQARWEHLNREDSLLTRAQAIFLDGHFVIEHTARNRSDRWINFNGTAGLWRRTAIDSAGGWQHDTLTEDVDLSYRAQLQGWNFIFLPLLGCPAELPPEINAFKSQQHRWTKGSIQTARKLLPTLLAAPIPMRVKVEAFFHLTSPMCYLYITLMAILFYPAIFVNMQVVEEGSMAGLLLGGSLFALGTVSASVFYLASQRAQNRSVWATILQLPVLMAIGIGIAINNARGCLEALVGHDSPFVRTPKYGSRPPAQVRNQAWTFGSIIPTPSIKGWMALMELGMGIYMLECIRLSLVRHQQTFISTPFLLVFASGYLYVGIYSVWCQVQSWRPMPATAV